MIHTMRALFVCALLAGFMCLSGCSGGAGTGGGSQPASSGNTGTGSNQVEGFNERVVQILPVSGSGDVYVSGDFTTYNGQAVRPVVRLRPDGSVNDSFALATAITGGISSIALVDDGSGDLYVADSTVDLITAPHPGIGHVRRVNADGSIDPAFAVGTITVELDAVPSDPTFRPVVRGLASAGDGSGRVYAAVGGLYNGTTVGPVVRINSNGTLDTSFATQTTLGSVFRIVPADDGSGATYIATFRRDDPNTWLSHLLLRLNADGTLDSGFDTGVRSSTEARISLMVPVGDGSGDLFAAGVFPNFSDPSPIVNAFRGLVRFNSNGSVDLTSPRPLVDPLGSVVALAKAADGSGKWFLAQRLGLSDVKVLRYLANGTLDPAFAAAQIDGIPHDLLPASDGTGDLDVGGDFLSVNGRNIHHFVRLNGDGSLDAGTAAGP